MGDDSRLAGQERYLEGATLVKKPYRAWSEAWEHDHCAFCWAKFVDPDSSEARRAREDSQVLTEGYAALGAGPNGEDDYHWVCERCFNDFYSRFGWHVQGGEPHAD
jgi:hypothetical protein